jgi:hypothetical protein
MSKIIWQPVCLLVALALVLSLAAAVLTFALPSPASAQDGEMVCQTSLISYSGSGASTTHNFTVPTGATGGYVLVEYRGDFGDFDEFIEVYIEGDYIGVGYNTSFDCAENWTEKVWSLGEGQISGWAADGMISVTVENSYEVPSFCDYNQHRVTLCYTTAPIVCQESLISYNGSGANTTHNFSVPPWAAAGYVIVEYRGDFGFWGEFIDVYIEGDYIGSGYNVSNNDCIENWTAKVWPLSTAQMSGWAADGTVSVRVQNSEEVDDFCDYDQHRVTLCYTTALPANCQQSLISYNGSGANTTHNFSVPVGATDGYVIVEYRGDFGGWSESWNWTDDEFIVVYIEGDYIGRDHTDLDDCDGNWTAATWPLSAAQMRVWAADGMISVMVQNSEEVDACPEEIYGSSNQHRVTLCYTEAEGPPVGGEAYPVSRISLLAPWIALGVVAAGAGVLVIRRRRAQS